MIAGDGERRAGAKEAIDGEEVRAVLGGGSVGVGDITQVEKDVRILGFSKGGDGFEGGCLLAGVAEEYHAEGLGFGGQRFCGCVEERAAFIGDLVREGLTRGEIRKRGGVDLAVGDGRSLLANGTNHVGSGVFEGMEEKGESGRVSRVRARIEIRFGEERTESGGETEGAEKGDGLAAAHFFLSAEG